MVERYLVLAVIAALTSSGCSKKPDDATIGKQLTGIWSFNPREQLSSEKIDENIGVYTTPDGDILQLGSPIDPNDTRGEFVHYVHIPKHVPPTSGDPVPARWTIRDRGHWFFFDGKVTLQGRTESSLTVTAVSSNSFRSSNYYLGCRQASCTLRRLDELPAEARSAQTW